VSLNYPLDACIDPFGNLYFSVYYHPRVYRLSPRGELSVAAGNGFRGSGGDGGPAVRAELNHPVGLVTDLAGNLYIADAQASRVRRVERETGIITTVAGGGLGDPGGPAAGAFIGKPIGLDLDLIGNLYILDAEYGRVHKVDSRSGILSFCQEVCKRTQATALLDWSTNLTPSTYFTPW
jgi:hypothetical protein